MLYAKGSSQEPIAIVRQRSGTYSAAATACTAAAAAAAALLLHDDAAAAAHCAAHTARTVGRSAIVRIRLRIGARCAVAAADRHEVRVIVVLARVIVVLGIIVGQIRDGARLLRGL